MEVPTGASYVLFLLSLTEVGGVQLLSSFLPPSAPLKPFPCTGTPHTGLPLVFAAAAQGGQKQECHLCVLPLPGSSLPVSLRKEFIRSSAVLVFTLSSSRHLQIAWLS